LGGVGFGVWVWVGVGWGWMAWSDGVVCG